MDIEEIKAQVRANQYVYTHHAEIERRADELTFAQVEEALLNGEILEQYPDTGRGRELPRCRFCRGRALLFYHTQMNLRIFPFSANIPCQEMVDK